MELKMVSVEGVPAPQAQPSKYRELLRRFVKSGQRWARVDGVKSAEGAAKHLQALVREEREFSGIRVLKRGEQVFVERQRILKK